MHFPILETANAEFQFLLQTELRDDILQCLSLPRAYFLEVEEKEKANLTFQRICSVYYC